MNEVPRTWVISLISAMVWVASTLSSSAESVVLQPSRDNSIFEENSAASDALGPLFCGRAGPGSRRMLLAFDIAGAVPPGSIVTDVRLEMFVDKVGPLASPDDAFELHRVLADWGEGISISDFGQGAPATPGDVTWSDRFFGAQIWANLGGDFQPVPSGGAPIPSQPLMIGLWPPTPEMVFDVQSWLDDPANNFGWVVIGPEAPTSVRSARRFHSREGANPPELFIEFLPPPAPPGVPDGRSGPPMRVGKLDPLGSQLRIEWDPAVCPGDLNHHLIFSGGPGLPVRLGGFYGVQGGVCGVGPQSPYVWEFVPDPLVLDPLNGLLWFIVAADDDGFTEGSWGQDSRGNERNGLGAGGSSGQCGMSVKELTNECGQGCAPLDFFATAPDSPTQFAFGTAAVAPIPAGFFEPGSEPFVGAIDLLGVPPFDEAPLVDTIIRRSDVLDLDLDPIGTMRQVEIQLEELSLSSVQPFTVITDGQPTEWAVSMGLSDEQQPGMLEVTKTHATGGTAQATIPVTPRFAFARQSELDALEQGLIGPDDVDVRVLDFSLEQRPAIRMTWLLPMPWSSERPRDGGFFCPGETFFIGRDSSGNKAGPIDPSSPCAPGVLPPLVPVDAPTSGHFLCPPPRPPE